MYNEYGEYREAFEEWSKETGHGLDKREMSDLRNKIRRLTSERNKAWNDNVEEFQKETN